MAATENLVTQDPLGLQTFALTESAYDLMTSLIGIYERLLHLESERRTPNNEQISTWEGRLQQIHELYYRSDWATLTTLPEHISTLTQEYKQMSQQENEYVNAAHPRAKAVLPY